MDTDSKEVPEEYAAFQALLRKVVKPDPKPVKTQPAPHKQD
jgi:hypothetical protein